MQSMINQTLILRFEHVPQVWLLFRFVDGTWVIFPLAIIGAALNGFLLWILRTKANLQTCINASISAECLARLVFCGLIFPYKAWILSISPLLGLSALPSPQQCFLASALSYLTSVAQVIFNLLTNTSRYMYIRAGNANNKRAIRISTFPRLHRKMLVFGGLLLGLHAASTKFAEGDQFIFDQGCLRPSSEVKQITAPTKYFYQALLIYFIPSTLVCALILRYLIYEKKRLNQSLNAHTVQHKRPNKNLYTAGTGLAQVVLIFLFFMLLNIPLMAAQLFGVQVTSSVESFILDFSMIAINGIFSPVIIFWSSSETRAPAVKLVNQALLALQRFISAERN